MTIGSSIPEAAAAGAGTDVETGDGAASGAAACLFRSLGDASRVAILRHLLSAERNVAELTHHLGLAQSTVSKHLACLRDCGLVQVRPVGRSSVYSLTHESAIVAVLAAAELLLAATGDAVVLCPTYGAESAP